MTSTANKINRWLAKDNVSFELRGAPWYAEYGEHDAPITKQDIISNLVDENIPLSFIKAPANLFVNILTEPKFLVRFGKVTFSL